MIWMALLLQLTVAASENSTLSLETFSYYQEGYLSPQQQRTLMEYAGPNAKPIVPTAIKRTSEQDASFVAKWLADQRKQSVTPYSFDPKKQLYYGKDGKTLDAVFQAAADSGKVLYFDDAEILFGLANPNAEQKDLAKAFVLLAKKAKGAVLVQCINDNSWYALAEGGFGIVDMKL